MASVQNLKQRMKSVENIGQITKAMELVAATKMRRAQELALTSRPYAYTALSLLGTLSALTDVPMPELLSARPVEREAFLLMTSDKGLAGSFNSAVLRRFESYVRERNINLNDARYSFIAVGQKAKSYLERRGLNVVQSFVRVGDYTTMEEIQPISEYLVRGYLGKSFDSVTAFFTTFVTALSQDAVVREFLPVSYEKIKESIEETIPRAGRYSDYARAAAPAEGAEAEYIIEPSATEVFTELAPALLSVRIYHMILEANAAEHSARRVAMKNASDNAADLSENLNVEYNKSRQAGITREIIEVTSGAQSLS